MGAKHSLEDDLITFKLTSKQFARSSAKCKKQEAVQKEKLRKAIAAGNMEGARIYGENVIREKNQALNFLRLGSRIDAVASRLEVAIRMQDVNKAMGETVKGMSSAMKSMDPVKISATMEKFEKSFEDMDVASGTMEAAMESTTGNLTPPEEVDNLIQMVADEAGLTLSGQMDSAGPVGTQGIATNEQAAKKDDLESRLAALRNA
jgi:charged multivesicular body protein 1